MELLDIEGAEDELEAIRTAELDEIVKWAAEPTCSEFEQYLQEAEANKSKVVKSLSGANAQKVVKNFSDAAGEHSSPEVDKKLNDQGCVQTRIDYYTNQEFAPL